MKSFPDPPGKWVTDTLGKPTTPLTTSFKVRPRRRHRCAALWIFAACLDQEVGSPGCQGQNPHSSDPCRRWQSGLVFPGPVFFAAGLTKEEVPHFRLPPGTCSIRTGSCRCTASGACLPGGRNGVQTPALRNDIFLHPSLPNFRCRPSCCQGLGLALQHPPKPPGGAYLDFSCAKGCALVASASGTG